VPGDIGESLVGSYLRYVVGCEVVVFNTHTPGEQGELDVIGIKQGNPRTVWLCEVITHIRGTLYGTGYEATAKKVRDKVGRARDFAAATFPGDAHRYEIWSPIVPSGMVQRFEALADEFSSQELDVEFVSNSRYTERLQELVEHARRSSKATNDPAYRLLQILTRLRGDLRV
jgi:hypothetical protein